MKVCKECKQEKPLTEFYFYKYANREPYPYARCKPCHRTTQEYVKPDRSKHRRESRRSAYEWLNTLKQAPCVDCEVQYPPYVMDFDHVKPGKFKNIAKMPGRYTRATILAEIALCELVCANCHRERTYQRRLTAKAQ